MKILKNPNDNLFRVKQVSDHSLPTYIVEHIGKIFEPIKTTKDCIRYQEGIGICFNGKCPGKIQAPWMPSPQCWGYGDAFYLEEVK